MNTTALIIIETVILFLWIFLSLYLIKSSFISITVVVAVSWIYLWMYGTAMLILAGGIYVFCLITCGEALLDLIIADRKEDRIQRILSDFLTGSVLHMIIFFIFGFFGIGGVKFSYILLLCMFAVSTICIGILRYSKKRIIIPCAQIPSENELSGERKSRLWICIAYALMGTMMLLQAGRIGIQLCADSQGYALPLIWWMLCGIILCTSYLVGKHRTRRAGLYAAGLVSVLSVLIKEIPEKMKVVTILFLILAIICILDDRIFKLLNKSEE